MWRDFLQLKIQVLCFQKKLSESWISHLMTEEADLFLLEILLLYIFKCMLKSKSIYVVNFYYVIMLIFMIVIACYLFIFWKCLVDYIINKLTIFVSSLLPNTCCNHELVSGLQSSFLMFDACFNQVLKATDFPLYWIHDEQ